MLLFASWDQGGSYQQVASVKPDKSEFIFKAQNDGTCWLKVAVIDRQGKQLPDNIQLGPPDEKIIFDTMKPVVRTFTAQRQSEEVTANWEILEDHFDPQGFRLEYQTRDNPGSFWTTISQTTPGLTGQVRFRPTSAGPLVVRLIAKDQAGNQSFANAEVNGLPGTGINPVSFNPPPAPLSPPNNSVPAVIPPPTPPPSTLDANSFPPPVSIEATKQPNAPTPSKEWAPVNNAAIEPKERLIASSIQPPAPAPQPVAPVNNVAAGPQRTLPVLEYVNHSEVVLDYKLKNVGKSGIGSVELWMTKNDGQTWERYAFEKDVNTLSNGPQPTTVELPGEGIFGFSLVVKSRAGLGKAPPKDGDVPEIRVEVDTTPPIAELYAPRPDPQKANSLLLKWIAKDKNLSNNPITLEWSERREGPWVIIVDKHPNTRQYSWQLPDGLPVSVYLRLKVRDLAENETIAVTSEPELVDLSEPEGTLIKVSVPHRP